VGFLSGAIFHIGGFGSDFFQTGYIVFLCFPVADGVPLNSKKSICRYMYIKKKIYIIY